MHIFFFDEIQNMVRWELFVNKLHRRGYNVFITGSNARLLARELTDRITGRHISMTIYPFSFREFLKAAGFSEDTETTRGIGLIKKYLEDYSTIGGFPEVVVEKENPRIYLRTLFNDIIERDIASRYSIREETTFREMAYLLLSNASRYITYNRLKNKFIADNRGQLIKIINNFLLK